MKALNWHVEEDSFTDLTPYGEKRFTNVIATKDPDAPRRVVVSAHFDSKFFSSYPANQVRDDMNGTMKINIYMMSMQWLVSRRDRFGCPLCNAAGPSRSLGSIVGAS